MRRLSLDLPSANAGAAVLGLVLLLSAARQDEASATTAVNVPADLRAGRYQLTSTPTPPGLVLLDTALGETWFVFTSSDTKEPYFFGKVARKDE